MTNLVNTILFDELKKDFGEMGSCLVLSFDKLTVADANSLRTKLRQAGVSYRVVKNRLATKAFASLNLDMSQAFRGKCGIVLAQKEGAIGAAKLVRDAMKTVKVPPLVVTGAVVEGEAITGAAATAIADMPDRHTVNTQLVTAISGPARALASCVQALSAGLARVIQAKIDKAGGSGADADAASPESEAAQPSSAAPGNENAPPVT